MLSQVAWNKAVVGRGQEARDDYEAALSIYRFILSVNLNQDSFIYSQFPIT